MRVLHLTTEFPPIIWGGLGTAVGGLATASARARMKVAVVLTTGATFMTYAGYRYARKGSRRVDEVQRDAQRVNVFELPINETTRAAVQIVRRWRPDVIHLHSFWLWGIASTIRSETGVPIVYTVHSLDRAEYDIGQGPRECLDQWDTQRAVINGADRIIALTQSELELIGSYCPGASRKVSVVGNGIADSIAARQALRNTRREPSLMLFTGRFVDRKGVRDLLSAMPRVLEEAPESRLVLAGGHRGCSGAEMERWWLSAAAYPYRDRIHFTGWLTADELASWYERAEVLVVPSWYEPFGMVVLEGMLYGLAIAAAAVGGPLEILDEGRTGLLFEPRNPTSLGDALLRVLHDSSLRRRLAEAAAREVRTKWLWHRIVGKVRRAYAEAITDRQC